jgi:predicted ABC-type ATPase
MFNVCPKCGEYTELKDIDPAGPFAICPICHHRHPFAWLPLFVVSGASGTGKSTICLHLPAALPECVTMETDILWGQVAATPDDNYRSYRNAWLRIAKNIGQGGRPVVLCGTALPDQIEPCPERRYFTTVHYLALVCDDDLLADRLRRRPGQLAVAADFIERMRHFNRWIQQHAAETAPAMTFLDTTHASITESVEQTTRWVRSHRSPAEASPRSS